MASKLPPTNMIVLRPSRKKPKPGDLFVCNLQGKRWVVGRVIHIDCRMMSDTPGNEPLLYFYRINVSDPSILVPPIRPDLLIAPVITDFQGWRDGVFQTMGNYPLLPEERLPRHLFLMTGFTIDQWNQPGTRYHNEFDEEQSRPMPGEHWSIGGRIHYRAIDKRLSEAIGMQSPIGVEREPAQEFCEEDEVVVYIPNANDEELNFAELEGSLIRAIEESGTGQWEGHGYDLQQHRTDIRFNGSDPTRIADVLLPILRSSGLPHGSFVMVGGERRRRVLI